MYTDNEKPNYNNRISVLLAGFPENTKLNHVENYLDSISGDREYTTIKKNNKKFRGFAFIHFDSKEEAEQFICKELRFEGKLLDYKLSESHNEYLQNC